MIRREVVEPFMAMAAKPPHFVFSTQVSFMSQTKPFTTGSAFAESVVPIHTVQSRGNF
jgi:hypothetical protein